MRDPCDLGIGGGGITPPGLAEVSRRYLRPVWGLSTDKIEITDTVHALSIGPNSDADAYTIESNQFGPFVLSHGNPWIGKLEPPVYVVPYYVGVNNEASTPGAGALYVADIVAWKKPPMQFAQEKRRPRMREARTPAAATQVNLFIPTMGRRRVRWSFIANAGSAYTVSVLAVACRLPPWVDGSNGAVEVPDYYYVPDTTTYELVAASSRVYREIDLTSYGLNGADFMGLTWAAVTAGQAPTYVRIETFDD